MNHNRRENPFAQPQLAPRYHPYDPTSRRQTSDWQQPQHQPQQYQVGPSRQPIPYSDHSGFHATQLQGPGYDQTYRASDWPAPYYPEPYRADKSEGFSRQHQYPYPYPFHTMSNPQPWDYPQYSAEPMRTQPGHEYLYDADSAAESRDARYRPAAPSGAAGAGYGQPQRMYSTRATPPYDSRLPSTNAIPGPSNRRVSELGGQAAASTSSTPPHRRGDGASSAGPAYRDSTYPSYPASANSSARASGNSSRSDSPFDSSFDSASTRPSKRKEFIITLPTSQYISLSDPVVPPPPPRSQGGSTKLLVLDLNGALIYRDKGAGDKRRSYPRPYLAPFLEYLFLPEPLSEASQGDSERGRPWEVFVWSSAQPDNVRGMVEASFGEAFVEGIWKGEVKADRKQREKRGEGRLIGVWARDKLGLSAHDYRQKVQTVKDLRHLSDHLDTALPNSPSATLRQLRFDESNMVLLDDSPLKAVHQPWNEIILPEYDRVGYQTSRLAVVKDQQDGETVPEGMDDALVCVVGILEEMRGVENVPAWIRSGGLTPHFVSAGKPLATEMTNPIDIPSLESLPSHKSFQHWHAIPSVRQYWLKRGKAALSRKGIELRTGIDSGTQSSSGGMSPRYSPGRTSAPNNKEMTDINGAFESSSISGKSPRHRVAKKKGAGGYSPSRPAEMSFSRSPSPATHTGPVSNSPIGVTAGSALSAPSRLDSAGQGPSSSTVGQRGTKSQPADRKRLTPVSSWRTFNATDVAVFLSDMSDRSSVPLTPEQRAILSTASSILEGLGSGHDEQVGPVIGEVERACLECMLREGKKAKKDFKVAQKLSAKQARKLELKNTLEGKQKEKERLGKGKGKEKVLQAEGQGFGKVAAWKREQGTDASNIGGPAENLRSKTKGTAGTLAIFADVEHHFLNVAYNNLGPEPGADFDLGGSDTVQNDPNLPFPPHPVAAPGTIHNLSLPINGNKQARTKSLNARDRLAQYRSLRPQLDILIARHVAADTPETLQAVRNFQATLDQLRKAIRGGTKKQVPGIAEFLKVWEVLPGAEYLADKAGGKVKKAATDVKVNVNVSASADGGPFARVLKKQRRGKTPQIHDGRDETETINWSSVLQEIPEKTALRTAERNPRDQGGVEIADPGWFVNVKVEEKARVRSTKEAVEAVNGYDPKIGMSQKYASVLVLTGRRRLGRVEGKAGDKKGSGKLEMGQIKGEKPFGEGEDSNASVQAVYEGEGAVMMSEDEGMVVENPNIGPSQGLGEGDGSAYSDSGLMAQATRGDLTIMILAQIYQDIRNDLPLSFPRHVGRSTLSNHYFRRFAQLQASAPAPIHTKKHTATPGPKEIDAVSLAMIEAGALVESSRGEVQQGVSARSRMEVDEEVMDGKEVKVEKWEEVGMPPIIRRAEIRDEELGEDEDEGIQAARGDQARNRYFPQSAIGPAIEEPKGIDTGPNEARDEVSIGYPKSPNSKRRYSDDMTGSGAGGGSNGAARGGALMGRDSKRSKIHDDAGSMTGRLEEDGKVGEGVQQDRGLGLSSGLGAMLVLDIPAQEGGRDLAG